MRELFLIIHFIGLAMGLGTSLGFVFIGKAAESLPPEERGKFMMNVLILRRMGQTGMVLLILSGLYLMTPYWNTLSANHSLITKLALVVILIGFMIYSESLVSKARKENSALHMGKIRRLGPFMLVVVLGIITLAVLTFK
jgi:uncharacterized membrane protein